MDTDFDPDEFKINPAHGSDAGVLICEASGIFISPVLYTQAVCPAQFPLPQSVPWQRNTLPPKAFAAHNTLPVLYGEAGRVTPAQNFLHLFSLPEPAVKPFLEATQIADWNFPVPLCGIVVLFEYQYDTAATGSWLSRLRRTPAKNAMLAWVQTQALPYVVGAMGYHDRAFLENQFRAQHEIPRTVPILAGAPPSQTKPDSITKKRSTGSTPLFSGVFKRSHWRMDREYCKQILTVLTALPQWTLTQPAR